MKKEYIKYELEKRKYSANCVVGIYLKATPIGKLEEHKDLLLIPALNKEDGDMLAGEILNLLNAPPTHWAWHGNLDHPKRRKTFL